MGRIRTQRGDRVAKLSKWAIFFRAFLVVFLSGTATRVVVADEGEQAAWADARRQCTADALFGYLSRYPSGEHVEQALSALSELGAVQVVEGEAFSSFCLNPVRELPRIPAQAQRPTAEPDDPY